MAGRKRDPDLPRYGRPPSLMGLGVEAMSRTILTHKTMVALARDHTYTAIQYLVMALHKPNAPIMAKLKAAELLLAYGWGKPPQALSISTDTHTPGQGLAALSIAERVRAITESQLGPGRVPIEIDMVRPKIVTLRAGEEFV